MAGRIQGITVEIGGDTTKLQTALKGVNGHGWYQEWGKEPRELRSYRACGHWEQF